MHAMVALIVRGKEQCGRAHKIANRGLVSLGIFKSIRPNIVFLHPEVMRRWLEGMCLAAPLQEKAGYNSVPPDVGTNIYKLVIVGEKTANKGGLKWFPSSCPGDLGTDETVADIIVQSQVEAFHSSQCHMV